MSTEPVSIWFDLTRPNRLSCCGINVIWGFEEGSRQGRNRQFSHLAGVHNRPLCHLSKRRYLIAAYLVCHVARILIPVGKTPHWEHIGKTPAAPKASTLLEDCLLTWNKYKVSA